MPLSYRLRKVVDSTELCAYLNDASLNVDQPIIMTNPSYYDSQYIVSPNLCPLYNLNSKHRTRTPLIYIRCYASLLIVPYYEKNILL